MFSLSFRASEAGERSSPAQRRGISLRSSFCRCVRAGSLYLRHFSYESRFRLSLSFRASAAGERGSPAQRRGISLRFWFCPCFTLSSRAASRFPAMRVEGSLFVCRIRPRLSPSGALLFSGAFMACGPSFGGASRTGTWVPHASPVLRSVGVSQRRASSRSLMGRSFRSHKTLCGSRFQP